MQETEEYTCSKCGETHKGWPAFAFQSPDRYHKLSESDKKNRGDLKDDFCIIRSLHQIDYYIRVVVNIPVNDDCRDLEYGLWVQVSEPSFRNYWENFKNEDYLTEFKGFIANDLPGYKSTIEVPVIVKTQPDNQRPIITPKEDNDHPFTEDLKNAISLQEAENRLELKFSPNA